MMTCKELTDDGTVCNDMASEYDEAIAFMKQFHSRQVTRSSGAPRSGGGLSSIAESNKIFHHDNGCLRKNRLVRARTVRCLRELERWWCCYLSWANGKECIIIIRETNGVWMNSLMWRSSLYIRDIRVEPSKNVVKFTTINVISGVTNRIVWSLSLYTMHAKGVALKGWRVLDSMFLSENCPWDMQQLSHISLFIVEMPSSFSSFPIHDCYHHLPLSSFLVSSSLL